MKTSRLLLFLALSLTGSGCAIQPAVLSDAPAQELTGITKYWVTALRAQQLIPAYPLTEDLLPGDIMILDSPLGVDEILAFSESGFLPIVNRFARLGPGQGGHGTLKTSEGVCAFPTLVSGYDTAASANLGLAIASTKVGGSATSTGNLRVNITIDGATSKTVDVMDAVSALHGWIAEHRNDIARAYNLDTAAFGVTARIVTQVYYTTSLTATISGVEVRGADANALVISDTNSLKTEIKLLREHTIQVKQTFAKPIAVGYTAAQVMVTPEKISVIDTPQLQILDKIRSVEAGRALFRALNDLFVCATAVGVTYPADQARAELRAIAAQMSDAAAVSFDDFVGLWKPERALVFAVVIELAGRRGLDDFEVTRQVVTLRDQLARRYCSGGAIGIGSPAPMLPPQ